MTYIVRVIPEFSCVLQLYPSMYTVELADGTRLMEPAVCTQGGRRRDDQPEPELLYPEVHKVWRTEKNAVRALELEYKRREQQ